VKDLWPSLLLAPCNKILLRISTTLLSIFPSSFFSLSLALEKVLVDQEDGHVWGGGGGELKHENSNAFFVLSGFDLLTPKVT
jgi:hypothetical protein